MKRSKVTYTQSDIEQTDSGTRSVFHGLVHYMAFHYSEATHVLSGLRSCRHRGTYDQAPKEWVQCQAGWGRLPVASWADSS